MTYFDPKTRPPREFATGQILEFFLRNLLYRRPNETMHKMSPICRPVSSGLPPSIQLFLNSSSSDNYFFDSRTYSVWPMVECVLRAFFR